MGSTGRTVGTVGGAAAGTAIAGPVGTVVGGALGGVLGGLFDSDNPAAGPNPANAQYGAGNGSDLSNQLAAQQYAAGLQQQQAQNGLQAGFYNNAQSNFDIANAAQMRGGPQIATNPVDQMRQLQALRGIQGSANQLNQTGNTLTAMGTAPMGDSYAAAQLKQGQDAAMAQQLSMARSGRSLGSGQAAMNQAAFNNSALNQQTNAQAATARIQEQQNYNQFQLGALGAAGQNYGAAGSQQVNAGNLASGVRASNEGVQAQNANLNLQQQQTNNQTTGLYNNLGAQQQGLGMQANSNGLQAAQFGQQQAAGIMGAQLQANTGLNGQTVPVSIANQNNANAHDAANVNAVSAGLGAGANAVASSVASSVTGSGGGSTTNIPNPNNPSQTTSAYQPIATASQNAGHPYPSSDANNKKNLTPLESVVRAAPGAPVAPSAALYTPTPAPASGGYSPPTYAQTIGALNNAYRPSQNAASDVLNHVSGAGAGPSASQAALLAHMQGKDGIHGMAPSLAAAAQNAHLQSSLSPAAKSALMGATSMPTARGAASSGEPIFGSATAIPTLPQAAPAKWSDVWNAPQLDPNIQAYLDGASAPPPAAAPAAAPDWLSTQFKPGQTVMTNDGPVSAVTIRPGRVAVDATGGQHYITSDAHSKTRIRELEGQLEALRGGPSGGAFTPQAPDTAALDQSYARQGQAPAIDLRPARGYSYEYKDPMAPGAAPGRQVGPMAQDLEKSPATAATVIDTPTGKQVDASRLTMVNTAALSEQQRKTQELEKQLAALQGGNGGYSPAPYDPSLYGAPRGAY